MAMIPSTGVLLAAVAAASLAAQSLAVRRATRDRPVVDVVAVTFLVNVLVLVPLTLAVHAPAFGLTRAAVAWFAIGGLAGSLVARVSLFVGIVRLGASRAEPLKSVFPVISVLAAVALLGEPFILNLVAGTLLIVVGGVGVTWESRASPATPDGRRLALDLSYPLLAALLLGIDPVLVRSGVAEGTPALVGLTIRVLAAGGGFAVYLLWRRLRHGTLSRPTIGRWGLLAAFGNTAYLLGYFGALARAPVSAVAPVLGASPLLVLVGATVGFEEEHVSARLWLAVAAIVAGVAIVIRA